MKIYDQIKEVLKNREGSIISTTELKEELKSKYGTNSGSVLPYDYCYNRVNNGIDFRQDNRLFRYIVRNTYEYLGERYPYTGKIYHKAQGSKNDKEVGEWLNGKMKYPL